MYKLTSTGTILRLADGANIPPDPDNADYKDFLAWRAAGNEPAAADPAPAARNATVDEKLALLGITVAELKAAIAKG